MSAFIYTNPPLLQDGHVQRADDAEKLFEQAEHLFQSNFDHHNMVASNPDGRLRGESFRKNGLTQFFRRRNRSEFWCVVAPRVAGNPGQSNQAGIDTGGYSAQGPQQRMGASMPGGSLKFRLRAPAFVLVYYTAVVSRANLRNDMRLNMSLRVSAWLEDGKDSPGSRAARMAETFLRVEDTGALYYERPDLSRGVFLNWGANFRGGLVPYDGYYNRVADRSSGTQAAGAGGPRLAEGWHELTHTIEICDDQADFLPDYGEILSGDSDYYPFSGGGSSISSKRSNPAALERSTNALIIGDTELIVFAKYDDQDQRVIEDRRDPPPEQEKEKEDIDGDGIGGDLDDPEQGEGELPTPSVYEPVPT